MTAGAVVLAGVLAVPAQAEPSPTRPSWPKPGEGANSGEPVPINAPPPGTLQEVRKPYVAISTNQEKGGNSFSLSTDLLFKTGSAELSGAAQANIEAVAEQLKKSGVSGDVRVVGHTDNVGDPKSNQKLSEQRATSVKDALGPLLPNTGITLAAEGKGETEPIAANSNDAGKAKNRRVAVVYKPQSGGGTANEPSSSSIAVSPADFAPAAASRTPEAPNPLASVQKTIANQGKKWTVRMDITEFRAAGRFIKIGYLTRMINQPPNENLYYGALFSGDTLSDDNYNALLLDKTGGEQLHPVITGKGAVLRDGPTDDYLGQPQYGWTYFPKPRNGGAALSFYVPALGTIEGLKLSG